MLLLYAVFMPQLCFYHALVTQTTQLQHKTHIVSLIQDITSNCLCSHRIRPLYVPRVLPLFAFISRIPPVFETPNVSLHLIRAYEAAEAKKVEKALSLGPPSLRWEELKRSAFPTVPTE